MNVTNQTLRYVELQNSLEKLKQLLAPQPTYTVAEEPDTERVTKISARDCEELAQEMEKLQTQYHCLECEIDRLQSADAQSGEEESLSGCLDAFEDKGQESVFYTRLAIAQACGINVCWKIAYKLYTAYEGRGYITMQARMSERDRQANARARAAVTRTGDRKMVEIAFGLAEILNALPGPEQCWDRDWLTVPQRLKIIEHAYAILRHGAAQFLHVAAAAPTSQAGAATGRGKQRSVAGATIPSVAPQVSLI